MRDTNINDEAGQSFQSQYKMLVEILHHLQSIVVLSDNELMLLFERLGSEEIRLEYWSRKLEDCIRANQ